MTPLELPFPEPQTSQLDEYVKELDRAVDACFLGELADAMARLCAPSDSAEPALVPL